MRNTMKLKKLIHEVVSTTYDLNNYFREDKPLHKMQAENLEKAISDFKKQLKRQEDYVNSLKKYVNGAEKVLASKKKMKADGKTLTDRSIVSYVTDNLDAIQREFIKQFKSDVRDWKDDLKKDGIEPKGWSKNAFDIKASDVKDIRVFIDNKRRLRITVNLGHKVHGKLADMALTKAISSATNSKLASLIMPHDSTTNVYGKQELDKAEAKSFVLPKTSKMLTASWNTVIPKSYWEDQD